MAPSDQSRICVIGSINMDMVVRAPRLPMPGETVLGGPFSVSPGGKGANQAVAAARMGAGVSFVGAVGTDAHGDSLLAVLAAEGIDVARVMRGAGPTGIAAISVGGDGENTIIVAPGANAEVLPTHVDTAREAIMAADAVVLQLELPLATVIRAAALAAEVGTTVVLNAAPIAEAKLPMELLASVDVLIVNETEAAALGGAGSPEAVAEKIGRMGPRMVVVTMGEKGAWYSHGEHKGHVPAFAVSPVDTVGAGDAFAGALATRWIEHHVAGALDSMGVMDAVCWASAAGALATMKAGAIPSLPMRADVVKLLRSQGG